MNEVEGLEVMEDKIWWHANMQIAGWLGQETGVMKHSKAHGLDVGEHVNERPNVVHRRRRQI
jgi:hypothetical protein